MWRSRGLSDYAMTGPGTCANRIEPGVTEGVNMTTDEALAAISRGDQPSRAALILAGLAEGQTAPVIAARTAKGEE
jgi:hypothetical protein